MAGECGAWTARLLLLAALACVAAAWPVFPPPAPGYSPTNCTAESAPIWSYHVHVLFWPDNEQHSQKAAALKSLFEEHFNATFCKGYFHQPDLCYFATVDKPQGPFLTGQWGCYVPLDRYAEVLSWFMQRRADLDVIVHPDTGCLVHDHTVWSLWGGYRWELDTSKLSHDQPWDDDGNWDDGAS